MLKHQPAHRAGGRSESRTFPKVAPS